MNFNKQLLRKALPKQGKNPLWKIRLLRYEFWPYWLFYTPLYPYGIWLALKARSFTYFTAVNPALHLGGLINTSKAKVLRQIDAKYVPKFVLVLSSDSFSTIIRKLEQAGIHYPFIAKPDMGERGKGVEKIENEFQLSNYLEANVNDSNIMFQALAKGQLELGVLYFKNLATGESYISSVVKKEFLSVTGNGYSTLQELIENHTRARFRLDYLLEKFSNQLHSVVPQGEKIILEPIGNHNRGTTFLDGNYLINDALRKVIGNIAQPIKGFYYGRFDLRVTSLEDLYAGRNISVLEVNGVNSEPAHIYQPGYGLLKAYQDVAYHMKHIYRIAKQNHAQGIPYAPLFSTLKEVIHHVCGK